MQLLSLLLTTTYALSSIASQQSHFGERLHLSRASAGAVLAQLNFNYSEPVTSALHIRYSQSLFALFKDVGLERLNFSISQGHWRSSLYGAAPLQGGAPGVELFAVFGPRKSESVESRFSRLVKQLNGLFCASFAIIGESLNAPLTLSRFLHTSSSAHVRYGAFTGDNICIENAEAFRKLLPCQRTGLTELLDDTQQLYESLFYSTSLAASLISDTWSSTVQINVLKPLTSKQISVYSIFRRRLSTSCAVADESLVVLGTSPEEELSLKSLLSNEIVSNPTLNLTRAAFVPSLIEISTFLRESQLVRGRFVSTIRSTAVTPIESVFVHLLPWQIHLWHSTAKFECENVWTGEARYETRFSPKYSRESPTLIEMRLRIPPSSVCSISYEFQKAFLRFYEYPPDSSNGIHVAGPILTVLPHQWSEVPTRLHGEPTIVLLPIPDFSMPFNIICFVCTIVAMFFQLMLTYTTKFMSTSEPPKSTLSKVLDAVKSRLRRQTKAEAVEVK